MKNWLEFKKLIDQIEASRGHSIDSKVLNLETSFKIMVINYGYLERVTKDIPVFSVKQQDEKDKRMLECARCFINFLSSAVAFKDHCRTFVDEVYVSRKEAFGGQYQQKIDLEFKGDALSGFVEMLRNVYSHDKMLPLGFLTKERDGKFGTRFTLFLKDFKVQSGFRDKGENFLSETKEDGVDVLNISHDYLHKSIFVWLVNALASFHAQDFEELEDLKKQARDILKDDAQSKTGEDKSQV